MFTRFVEPGRLALITYGPCAGKMCTIVDIVDQKRVVVDGPESVTGVRRHMMPVNRLSLTDLKAAVPRGAREKTLKKALEKDSVMKKWSETSWAKKLAARETRSKMSDFDRFKLLVARKKRASEVRRQQQLPMWLVHRYRTKWCTLPPVPNFVRACTAPVVHKPRLCRPRRDNPSFWTSGIAQALTNAVPPVAFSVSCDTGGPSI